MLQENEEKRELITITSSSSSVQTEEDEAEEELPAIQIAYKTDVHSYKDEVLPLHLLLCGQKKTKQKKSHRPRSSG